MWINPLEKTLLKRFWKKPDCALQQTVSLPYRTETGTICRATPITSAKFSLCTRTGGEFQANAETTESRWYAEDELPQLAEEKNNAEQIQMCFAASRNPNWHILFD